MKLGTVRQIVTITFLLFLKLHMQFWKYFHKQYGVMHCSKRLLQKNKVA